MIVEICVIARVLLHGRGNVYVNVTYSERVSVFLVIWHAKRLRLAI